MKTVKRCKAPHGYVPPLLSPAPFRRGTSPPITNACMRLYRFRPLHGISGETRAQIILRYIPRILSPFRPYYITKIIFGNPVREIFGVKEFPPKEFRLRRPAPCLFPPPRAAGGPAQRIPPTLRTAPEVRTGSDNIPPDRRGQACPSCTSAGGPPRRPSPPYNNF